MAILDKEPRGSIREAKEISTEGYMPQHMSSEYQSVNPDDAKMEAHKIIELAMNVPPELEALARQASQMAQDVVRLDGRIDPNVMQDMESIKNKLVATRDEKEGKEIQQALTGGAMAMAGMGMMAQGGIGGILGLGMAAQGLNDYKDTMQEIDPARLGYLNASNGISDLKLALNMNKNNGLG